jgi:hemerythrin
VFLPELHSSGAGCGDLTLCRNQKNAWMPEVLWKDKGGKMVNVAVIHQQHRELMAKLEVLNEAIKDNKSREEIYRLIDEVILFTRLHFETEEQLMAESGYEHIESHKEKHRLLIQDALHLKDKLNHIGEQMFTDWFKHWPFTRVIAHIQYADKQIEDHIAQHGDEK